MRLLEAEIEYNCKNDRQMYYEIIPIYQEDLNKIIQQKLKERDESAIAEYATIRKMRQII